MALDEAVEKQLRAVAHEALDQWLDRCGERPLRWDEGEFHSIKFEAGVAGYEELGADERALWSIVVERREREDL